VSSKGDRGFESLPLRHAVEPGGLTAWLPRSEPLLQGYALRMRKCSAALLRGARFSVNELPYCVYVLQSLLDENLYVGFTENLVLRLKAHNEGLVVSTAPRRPFVLVYCEYHNSRKDAQRREIYLKSSAGKKALKLMLRNALNEKPPGTKASLRPIE
jgi:putative endonuclease